MPSIYKAGCFSGFAIDHPTLTLKSKEEMICDSVITHLTGSLVGFQSQSSASSSHLAPNLTLPGGSFLICDSSFLVLQNVLMYLLQEHVGLKFLERQTVRPR